MGILLWEGRIEGECGIEVGNGGNKVEWVIDTNICYSGLVIIEGT